MTNAGRAAAVVGAGGFIGAALVRALDEARIPVVGFTRAVPFITAAGRLHDDLLKADTLFWVASSIRPATAASHHDDVAADHEALTRLLDGLHAAGSGDTRVVAVSSGGTVYDSTSASPHTESSPLAAANEYGEAMLGIESLVRTRSSDPVVMRVANAYGPGQPARQGQGVIAYWLSAVAAGDPIQILGPDDIARDYVFIRDVVDALVRTHSSERAPRVVNIGSGTPTTLRQLVHLIRETVAPEPVAVHHDQGRSFDAPSTWLDVSLAAAELDWKPRTDLAAGLRQTWQHLKRQ